MSNNNKLFIFLFISLAVAVVAYLALENIFVSIGILALYLVTTILLLLPKFKKYDIVKNRYHECYHFINNFIITLSIKKSISGALETTVGSMNSEFVDMFNGLENMSENEKLDYLATYFEFYDYSLFLQIVYIWQEEGGDIISMSKYLISNIRHNEEYLTKTESISKRKYVEIGILWTISLSIVVVLRFALSEFYEKVKGQILYVASISIILAFALLTIFLLVQKGTSLNLKGKSNHEKVA